MSQTPEVVDHILNQFLPEDARARSMATFGGDGGHVASVRASSLPTGNEVPEAVQRVSALLPMTNLEMTYSLWSFNPRARRAGSVATNW